MDGIDEMSCRNNNVHQHWVVQRYPHVVVQVVATWVKYKLSQSAGVPSENVAVDGGFSSVDDGKQLLQFLPPDFCRGKAAGDNVFYCLGRRAGLVRGGGAQSAVGSTARLRVFH